MGFNKVYRTLQEVFPQIDARVLRAVAIEHSKDADAAVETVLTEIIPFFTERSRPSTPLSANTSVGESSEVRIGGTSNAQPTDGPSVDTVDSTEVTHGYTKTDGGQSFHDVDAGNNDPIYDTYAGHHGEECNIAGRVNVSSLQIGRSEGLQTYETSPSEKFLDCGIEMSSGDIPSQALDTLHDVDTGTRQNVNLFEEVVICELGTELSTTARKESEYEKSLAYDNASVVGDASLTVDVHSTDSFKSTVHLGVLSEVQRSDLEELDTSLLNETDSRKETGDSSVLSEDANLRNSSIHSEDANLNDSMSQASQIHIIEVLEQVIADAKNNKTTLFSTMHSVINLMKEVELKEQTAEQVKVEAAMGGNDILVKVEELKQMIQHAKEANSMHAGEVYGEKSILSSELRELQSRVLSLSDERDKSLAVLDEMRLALELRLAEAENEIKSAEQRKVEKEKAAMKALADEELTMEEVVQESKILKQQAEDNAKLQEFLVDHGRIVDMLQGEIAVICQDVRLLKEKFDDHIPFSKSLSSSQTSCILASSISSLNGSSPKEVEPVPNGTSDSLEPTEKEDPAVCFDEQLSEEKVAKDDGKALLEDEEWELFDGIETFG